MIHNPSLRSYESIGARMRVGAFRRKWLPGTLVVFAVAMVTATPSVMADTFGPVHYDPKSDQLIVTILYAGTNPDHRFTVQWGQCRKLEQQGAPVNQITLSLLDNQYLDQARKSYTKTVRVPVGTLSCRPARVTLRTSPFFYSGGRVGPRATVDIP